MAAKQILFRAAAREKILRGIVVDRMLHSGGNVGFDAACKQYVDLVEAGIIDPAKVVRTALENAVSVADRKARKTGEAGAHAR